MNGTRISRVVGLIGLATSLAACPPSSGGDVSLDQLPNAMTSPYCDFLTRCAGGAAALEAGLGGPCSEVVPLLVEDSIVARVRDGIERGTIIYHGDRVRACFDALQGADCTALSQQPAGCQDMFEGTVSVGGACVWSEECDGGYCEASSACPGTCRAFVAEGGDCSDARCDVGLECVSGRCERLSREGEACGGDRGVSCAGGLTCEGSTPTTEGTCRAPRRPDLGESCGAGAFCREGLSCTYMAGGTVCVGPSERDGACALGFPDPCPSGQTCRYSGDSGTCVTPPGVGDACGRGNRCRNGLWCDAPSEDASGTCRERGRLGASCSSDSGCYSGACTASACAVPRCSS